MGRYLRWSTCAHCGQKITQTVSHGNWHPAFSGRTSKSLLCEGTEWRYHVPRQQKEEES